MIFDTIPKIILFITNIVIFLVGVATVTIGAILIWGQNIIERALTDVLNPGLKLIQLNTTSEILKVAAELISMSRSFGIAILVFGIVIVAISILGCVGVCCIDVALYIYGSINLILALAVSALVIYYFTNRTGLGETMVNKFGESVKNYVSLLTKDEHSVFVFWVTTTFKCCGIKDYKDFTSLSTTDTYAGVQRSGLIAPISCCKFTKTYTIEDATCPGTFTETNSHYKVGCKGPLIEAFKDYGNKVAYGLIALAIVLFIICALSFLAACLW